MRLKQVEVARELIEEFLTQGGRHPAIEVMAGIPAGARLVAVSARPNPYMFLKWVDIDAVRLIFEHESFPECDQGSEPQTIAIRFAKGELTADS